MIIKTNRKDLFVDYLKYLDPVLELKEIDRKVLGALLNLWYSHRFYDLDTLYKLLFSPETLLAIQQKLELSVPQFKKSIKKLNDKGLITSNTINDDLIRYIKDSKKLSGFEIKIQFKVQD